MRPAPPAANKIKKRIRANQRFVVLSLISTYEDGRTDPMFALYALHFEHVSRVLVQRLVLHLRTRLTTAERALLERRARLGEAVGDDRIYFSNARGRAEDNVLWGPVLGRDG